MAVWLEPIRHSPQLPVRHHPQQSAISLCIVSPAPARAAIPAFRFNDKMNHPLAYTLKHSKEVIP